MSNIKVTVHTEPFHYIEVRNLWTEQERKEMFDEMLYLENKNIFESAEKYDLDGSGNPLRYNKSGFIDSIWINRDYSKILKHNRKVYDLFANKKVKDSWYFDGLEFKSDATLVAYYEDTELFPHRDNSLVSAVSWFFKEPKQFSGGKLAFVDYDLTFEVTNDLTILFPSNIEHEVTKVSINDGYDGKQCGRFGMTQFLGNGMGASEHTKNYY